MKPSTRVNNVEKIQSEAATVGTSPLVDEPVNQIETMQKSKICMMQTTTMTKMNTKTTA